MPAPVKLGGTAVIVCAHNRLKRKTLELPFNKDVQEPFVCICCENLFIKFKREAEVNPNPICPICTKGV